MWLSLVFATALAEPSQADLVAAAASSVRPAECWPARSEGGSGAATVWARARTPGLESYCAALARSHARLADDPGAARAAALQAHLLEPDRAAPHVALGRAALSEGKLEEALAEFERAMSIDSRSVEHPLALHDYASTLRRAGRLEQARRAYGLLVPRTGLVPARAWRARVLLEAAHVAMTASVSNGKPLELDDALAYLREAALDPHQELRLDTALSLVLVLDRAQRTAQADALLGELTPTAAWAAQERPSYWARPSDLEALRALALERSAPAAATARYKRLLDDPAVAEPWKQALRGRLSRLEKAPAPRPRRRAR